MKPNSTRIVHTFWVVGISLAAMTLFEAAKQMLVPAITIWQSHFVTIFSGSAVAGLAAHFILKRYDTVNNRLRKEIMEHERTDR